MTIKSVSIREQLFLTAFVVAIVVIGGYWLSMNVHRSFFSFMLVLVALSTFFGSLMWSGGFNQQTGFHENRIRLAIASTLVLTYLVYFCTVIFFSSSAQLGPYQKDLLETFTDLLKIVFPFYFGATAVSEILQKKSNP